MNDPSVGIHQAERLAEPVRQDDRGYRGFNLLGTGDLALIVALTRGERQISTGATARVPRALHHL